MPPRNPVARVIRTLAVSAVWLCGFFLLGYFPILLARDVRVGLVILATAAIPFGATARGARRGAFRGLGLGLAAGAGIIWGMLVTKAAPPADLDRLALTYALAAVFLTTAVASLFALLAQRRRRILDQSWDQ